MLHFEKKSQDPPALGQETGVRVFPRCVTASCCVWSVLEKSWIFGPQKPFFQALQRGHVLNRQPVFDNNNASERSRAESTEVLHPKTVANSCPSAVGWLTLRSNDANGDSQPSFLPSFLSCLLLACVQARLGGLEDKADVAAMVERDNHEVSRILRSISRMTVLSAVF